MDAELVVNAVTWTHLHLRRAHGWGRYRAAGRTIGLAPAGFGALRRDERRER